MPYIIAALVLVLLIIVWYIAARNKIRRAEIKIDESLSGIDVALTKRFDCLTKLLDVVKNYASHEKETFFEVISLRNGSSISEKNEAVKRIDSTFDRINVIAENYPELRSSENFKQLQSSIMDTEEHLQAARRIYNNSVKQYNNMIVSFPSSIVASGMHCNKREFFAAEDKKREDVQMKF